jgi:hypothetical protein
MIESVWMGCNIFLLENLIIYLALLVSHEILYPHIPRRFLKIFMIEPNPERPSKTVVFSYTLCYQSRKC